MEWEYVKKLKTVNLIDEYERLVNYALCDSFRKCVMANNGGRPEKKGFDTDREKGCELKSFLSFNKEDIETVWKIFEWSEEELMSRYIPFGIDNFGNLICFDGSNDQVVFIDHEDLSVARIADCFDDFMNGLYE